MVADLFEFVVIIPDEETFRVDDDDDDGISMMLICCYANFISLPNKKSIEYEFSIG